eukprot:gnl/TRDRNA2_/TRDRNA2_60896_c0_seq1.p1 gnl/TRDRNA2_/TRDRNA2_60896_c0~~gnl/TRDRNA2_/TRDRNA2_60896_c0_seq1.p1  ORF type:complete len:442 (+),score=92.30 gnl/TRDRNA2_/TRDRNA2_60896_c0_seq1:115-1440(+)
MGDDWDPFGDPADEEPVVASKSKGASGEDGDDAEEDASDRLSCLRKPRKEGKIFDQEQFSAMLDELFAVEDTNTFLLREAWEPILEAMSLDGHRLMGLLWTRCSQEGILEAWYDNSTLPKRENLLTYIVDMQFGFPKAILPDNPNEIQIDAPPDGKFSGTVVFLFGWGGGTNPDLDDISAFYQELIPGVGIFRALCSAKESWGSKFNVVEGIKAAAKVFEAAEKPKLLVHLFSNGGFHTWTETLLVWNQLEKLADPDPLMGGSRVPPLADVLRGIILDSACDHLMIPGPAIQSYVQSLAPMVRAIRSTMHDGTEAGIKEAHTQGMKLMMLVMNDESPIKAIMNKKPDEMVIKMATVDAKTVHAMEPPVPLQFIYSKDDKIIRFESVEKYVEEVAARPNRADKAAPGTLVFEKSKHCFHKVNHKDKYYSCVKSFATNVVLSY